MRRIFAHIRDIWKDEQLITIIPQAFIFYQWQMTTDNGKHIIDTYTPSKLPCIFVLDPRSDQQIYEFSVPNAAHKIKELKPKLLEFLDNYPHPGARLLIHGYTRDHLIADCVPTEIIEMIFKWYCP